MTGKRFALAGLALSATACFMALGVWQIERRSWKLGLIARVEARIQASPASLLPSRRWPAVNEQDDAYRELRVSGVLLHQCETPVQALTEAGGGYWIMTPLRTADGIVLVNRGFVPSELRDPRTRAAGQVEGEVTVTGLLRMTEPKGTFLRSNDPAAGRWYSRDVGAIARACGLERTAPFFIDADATPNPGHYPQGGLTVLQFRNTHLAYAITWFALAASSLFAVVLVFRVKPEG